MPHGKRHRLCYYEDSSPDQLQSEESCHSPSQIPDRISNTFVVVEDVKEDAGDQAEEADASAEEPDLMSGPSVVIGQNEMVLLEMCVSRVVQEIENRCISRLQEMDRKVDTLTHLCSGLSQRLDTALGPTACTDDHEPPPSFSLPMMQSKLETLVHVCSGLAEKLEAVALCQRQEDAGEAETRSASGEMSPPLVCPAPVSTFSGVVALNSETDFPAGSWLGDPDNPLMRVRCHIHPLEMARLSRHCISAEKLAITLLDHLFPREVLAESNISGRGKHSKKQLDPLLIYGIYCHLVTHHSVTEKEWQRIRQNMDSKCRSMWKRKQRGKPLGIGKLINKQARRGGASTEVPSVPAGKAEAPGVVFADDAASLVVMEAMPAVGDVVEVEHSDYLSGMELSDFSNVKVIQTSLAEVRLLGGDSADLLPSNNVSLHEASARGDTERLQANSRQFGAVIREQPMDEKQQRLVFGGVND